MNGRKERQKATATMSDRGMTNVDAPTMKASGWQAVKGDPNALVCVSKATYSGEDGTKIMKSTKVVELNSGCLVFVTTEHSALGVAEAVTFVPGETAQTMRAAFGA